MDSFNSRTKPLPTVGGGRGLVKSGKKKKGEAPPCSPRVNILVLERALSSWCVRSFIVNSINVLTRSMVNAGFIFHSFSKTSVIFAVTDLKERRPSLLGWEAHQWLSNLRCDGTLKHTPRSSEQETSDLVFRSSVKMYFCYPFCFTVIEFKCSEKPELQTQNEDMIMLLKMAFFLSVKRPML